MAKLECKQLQLFKEKNKCLDIVRPPVKPAEGKLRPDDFRVPQANQQGLHAHDRKAGMESILDQHWTYLNLKARGIGTLISRITGRRLADSCLGEEGRARTITKPLVLEASGPGDEVISNEFEDRKASRVRHLEALTHLMCSDASLISHKPEALTSKS